MPIDTLTPMPPTSPLAAPRPAQPHPVLGLVLMGGGARTAYQAGALQAIGQLLSRTAGPAPAFPFQVLAGTSAGALNATFLASKAMEGLTGLNDLANFWTRIRTEAVYCLPQTPLDKFSRWATAVGLLRSARAHAAAMDSLALVNTLHRAIALEKIDTALQSGVLQALRSLHRVIPAGCIGRFAKPATASRSPGADRGAAPSSNRSPSST